MESPLLCTGFRRAISGSHRHKALRGHRCLATLTDAPNPDNPIRAAAPIAFLSDRNQFVRGRTDNITKSNNLLLRIRVVPASPSYFTGFPRYTDDLLFLSHLVRKYQPLPTIPAAEAPRVYWKTLEQYKADIAESVRVKAFAELVALLRRLNCIHPSLMPAEVANALTKYKRVLQPQAQVAKMVAPDKNGLAKASGRRKTSVANVTVVEGTGECLVNGKPMAEYFGRIHDRESALWALKATARLGKYNVWVRVEGGGTTGQAEAITLGVAKALLIHEPSLKPALRRAGVLTRNIKRVERKKPGKLKARKMPAWVKR